MERRALIIPTATALGLTFSPGCTDRHGGERSTTIVDRWNLVQVVYTYAGETYTYELPQTYSAGGCFYRWGRFLRVDEDLDGALVSYQSTNCPPSRYDWEIAAEVTVLEEGTHYYVQLSYDYGGYYYGYDYALDCQMDGDDLTCLAIPSDAMIEYRFERH